MQNFSITDYQRIINKRTAERHKHIKYCMLDSELNIAFISDSVSEYGFNPAEMRENRVSIHEYFSGMTPDEFIAIFKDDKPGVTNRHIFELSMNLPAGGKFKVTVLIYHGVSPIHEDWIYDVFFLSKLRPEFTEDFAYACEMETEFLFKRSLDSLHVPVLITEDQGIIYANDAFAKAIGYRLPVLHSIPLRTITSRENRNLIEELQNQIYEGKSVGPVRAAFLTQGGDEQLCVNLSGTPLYAEDRVCALNVLLDIGDDIKRDKRMKTYAHVFENMNVSAIIADFSINKVFYNKHFSREFGYDENGEMLLIEMMRMQKLSLDTETVTDFLAHFIYGDTYERFYSVQMKNGGAIPCLVTVSKISDNEFVFALIDMSKQIETEKKLDQSKTTDYLTGLENSTSLHTSLKLAFREAVAVDEPLSLILFDIDTYDNILSEMGPTDADSMLKMLSLRLRGFVGDNTIFGRLSSKCFAIILRNKNRGDTIEYIRELMSTLDWPVVIKDHDIFITASIGLAMYPDDALSVKELFTCANDARSFASKEARTAFAVFSREEGLQIETHRSSLEADLAFAMESDEFVVFFQPKADVNTCEIVECEALMRWESPVYGIVSPGAFLRLAEVTGMIVPLGYKVLQLSCAFLSERIAAGKKPIKICINLASAQISDSAFSATVNDILYKAGIDKCFIEFEISESFASYDDSLELLKRIEELRGEGIPVALDNVGTGKISEKQLEKTALTRMTIDRSITNGCENDRYRRERIERTIALSKRMGIKTIAEGVENTEQLEYLRTVGCDYYQGYYLSKPLSVAEFEKWLDDNQMK